MATSPSSTAQEKGTIYFWQEFGSDYAFLSQWYDSPFHTGDKSVIYQTAEQYMMHQKAILFNDDSTASKIMASASPASQKALGRTVKNFDKDVWVANRERIVTEGSYNKFMYSLLETENLKEKLMATAERELVEASPFDRIWGVGFASADAEALREEWGLNLLGKALTKARTRIREEQKVEGRKYEVLGTTL